eukprot:400026-Pyramimonas_sp.AAC.1
MKQTTSDEALAYLAGAHDEQDATIHHRRAPRAGRQTPCPRRARASHAEATDSRTHGVRIITDGGRRTRSCARRNIRS